LVKNQPPTFTSNQNETLFWQMTFGEWQLIWQMVHRIQLVMEIFIVAQLLVKLNCRFISECCSPSSFLLGKQSLVKLTIAIILNEKTQLSESHSSHPCVHYIVMCFVRPHNFCKEITQNFLLMLKEFKSVAANNLLATFSF